MNKPLRLTLASVVMIVMTVSSMSAMAAPLTSPQPERKSPVDAQDVGVFTGRFENGMPVYRFPPISVVGHRKVELAKLKREEQLARSKQVRVKAAIKGPA